MRPFEPLMDMFRKFENLKPAPGQPSAPFDEAEKNITIPGKHFRTFSSKSLTGLNRPFPLAHLVCEDEEGGGKLRGSDDTDTFKDMYQEAQTPAGPRE